MDGEEVEEAVQVVKSEDQTVLVDGKQETKKIIKVISQFRNGLSLRDLLHNDTIEDLPILVFSIAGKSRGGKSFLLNLMIKYLETQGEGEWLRGSVPGCFAWRCGTRSITRGLWLYPKIYRLTNCHGAEVGVMLLDNEGLFATTGAATDGEKIAISGVCTTISFLQMFNLKNDIQTDTLQNVVQYLVKGVEEMDGEDRNKDYKLMFVVRDWVNEYEFNFGLEGGHEYIQNDMATGTPETQRLWQIIENTFQDVKCLLLPPPGDAAHRPEFAMSGNLEVLNQSFLDQLKVFIEWILSPERLVPPENKLMGKDIYNILMSVDGKEANENLSWLNIFTDHGNFLKVQRLIDQFGLKLFGIPVDHLHEVKNLMASILNKAESTLQGKSAPDHLTRLKKDLEYTINNRVVESVLKEYSDAFIQNQTTNKTTSETHRNIWPMTQLKLHEYLCGDDNVLSEVMKKAVQNLAAIYYQQLQEELLGKFRKECSEKNLESLTGLDENFLKYKFVKCQEFGNEVGDQGLFHPIWSLHQQHLKDGVDEILVQRVEELTGVDRQILKNLRKKQYEYFELFTLLNKEFDGWDRIPKNNEKILKQKIGFAMFGLPQNSIVNNPGKKEYSSSEIKSIQEIAKKISSESQLDPIRFSCVFITLYKNNKEVTVPLFRIKQTEQTVNYIDTDGRLYHNWIDFGQTNNLPDCLYCCPLHGSYSVNLGFSVAFNKPPSSKMEAKVLQGTDVASKVVSGSAGVAAAVALAAPVVGIALAPAVGTFALIGGGVAGAYGVGRSIYKIWNKRKHKQKTTTKDILLLATNTFAVVGAGLGTAAKAGATAVEGAVSIVRAAQGVNGINALTIWIRDDAMPSLNEVLREMDDNSLKFLFYFNVDSSQEAVNEIRKALGLRDDTSTEKVLETLVEVNIIEAALETGGVVKMNQYVSEGITDLVESLMKLIRPGLRNIVIKFLEIEEIFKVDDNTDRTREMHKKILSSMLAINIIITDECDSLKKKVTRLMCEETAQFTNSTTPEMFLSFIMGQEGGKIIFIMRYLVSAIINRLRNANKFYNNLDHAAITLPGYDVGVHPLQEIVRRVRSLVEQKEFSINSLLDENLPLDHFLVKALNLFFECAKPNWRGNDFAKYLLQFTMELIGTFDSTLQCHQNIVQKNLNPNCFNVYSFFNKNKVQGDYGNWLLQNILDDFHFDPKTLESERMTSCSIILQACPGVLNHRLYCYFSSKPVTNKEDIVFELTKIKSQFIIEFPVGTALCFLEQANDPSQTYFIYSYLNNGTESGLIWRSL